MKNSLTASLAFALSAVAFGVHAAPAEPAAKTAQQSKMSTCNADAAGKKGDERKAFMKTCLSAKAPVVSVDKPMTAQQEKMKTCNTDAAGKKGDDRKAFMKSCLSDQPMAPVAMTQQQKMKACNTDATGKKGDERKAFMKTCLSTK
ncbi:PsiF family protein [Massilia sp. DWR3-1-1]|uniref:PsiF family protein n=1 Tax=Massilia sp. DWR3-1-1 TaxID=2804559 RepID=UPI003CE7674E